MHFLNYYYYILRLQWPAKMETCIIEIESKMTPAIISNKNALRFGKNIVGNTEVII